MIVAFDHELSLTPMHSYSNSHTNSYTNSNANSRVTVLCLLKDWEDDDRKIKVRKEYVDKDQ